ncbi:MAG: NAD-dependent epimerase/dehydratase family protein [Rhodospirillaceae bacterium]|nr:NAD-dependent epimerase/dehydratase family protein [Rhodospirillales bacterium]
MVLVTGASGFLGSAIVRALLARGYAIRALVRRNSPRRNLAGLDVELAEGDLLDAASLSAAMAGCDAAIHVAADYRLWASMHRTKVEGTLVGRPPPLYRLPLAAVVPVALVAEGWARVTGREPFVTLDGLRMARHRMFFTSAKAEQSLGYRHRPAAEALAAAVEWFRGEGAVT